jgi:hypothetical protein
MNGINVNDYGYIIRTDLKDLTSITERCLIDYIKRYVKETFKDTVKDAVNNYHKYVVKGSDDYSIPYLKYKDTVIAISVYYNEDKSLISDEIGLSLLVFKSLYVPCLDHKADVLVSEVPVNTSNLDDISAIIYELCK